MINVRASLNLLCYVCMSLKVVLFLNFTPENNFWSIVERRTEASPLSNWNISFWTQGKSKRDKRRRMKKRQETSWNANNVVRWVYKVLMYFIHFGLLHIVYAKKNAYQEETCFLCTSKVNSFKRNFISSVEKFHFFHKTTNNSDRAPIDEFAPVECMVRVFSS